MKCRICSSAMLKAKEGFSCPKCGALLNKQGELIYNPNYKPVIGESK